MVYGGIAGNLSWLVTYPLDVLKTIMQTQDLNGRMTQVAKERFQEQGARFFWRGLGPTLFRSFLYNAICLPGFDILN